MVELSSIAGYWTLVLWFYLVVDGVKSKLSGGWGDGE